MTYLDFVTVPIFSLAVVMIFNLITWQPLHRFFIALGKESMNMWFIHALFYTAVTTAVFGPLILWLPYKILIIAAMAVFSYVVGRLTTVAYSKI